MKRVFWVLFFACTAAGFALVPRGGPSWHWWDAVWALVFFVAVYTDMVGRQGLSATRLSAGVVVLAMAIMLGLGSLTGWPLRFTEYAGMRLGGALPLVVPLFAYALLTASREVASSAFPSARKAGLAAGTAAAFALALANGITFLACDRLWWLWNPWGQGNAGTRAILSVVILAAAAFGLAFVYPADCKLRVRRWDAPAMAWVAVNVLFFAARLAALRA